MYDFIDLKLVQYMAEEPTLSAVAIRAKMSLPAVSQRLARLEANVKAKLVFRAGGFGLTPEGKIFLATADTITAELHLLEDRLRNHNEAQDSLLRIACSDSSLLTDLPSVLKSLRSERPELELLVDELDRATACKRLTDGEADVILVQGGPVIGPVQSTPYKTERLCILAPLTHPIAQESKPVHLATAEEYDFIGLNHSKGSVGFIEDLCSQNGIRLRYRTQVNNPEAQCLLVGQSHLGLALVYESTARRHARTQPCAVIKLLNPWATTNFIVATKSRAELRLSGRRFIELLLNPTTTT